MCLFFVHYIYIYVCVCVCVCVCARARACMCGLILWHHRADFRSGCRPAQEFIECQHLYNLFNKSFTWSSLIGSPVFYLILIVLSSRWSRIFLWSPVLPVSLPSNVNLSHNFFSSTFGNCSKCSNCNWYHHRLHAPLLFQVSGKIQVFVDVLPFSYLLEWHHPFDDKFLSLVN